MSLRRSASEHDPTLQDAAARRRAAEHAPLAERLRPRRLQDLVGQSELLAPGGWLAAQLATGRLPSLLLWGPPGSGKTTLARLLAEHAGADLVALSAVAAGVAEVRAALQRSESSLLHTGRPDLLFVDEIHRFHKGQQDALLHPVEDGRVVLVGATTENPSFAVNAALLSRCHVLRLVPLDAAELGVLLERARGAESVPVVEDDARDELVALAAGDARRLLGLFERAAALAARADGRLRLEHVLAARGSAVLAHDKSGTRHHDLLSALHKSLRGSDPDAAAYYVQSLLVAGEDPLVVARRMVRMASEDVGLADVAALRVALDALEAVRFLGLPEGDDALVQAAIYLALAPKSDAVDRAARAARAAVERHGALPVPAHLQGSGRAGEVREAYLNPHQGPTSQPLLPAALRGQRFWQPEERRGGPAPPAG